MSSKTPRPTTRLARVRVGQTLLLAAVLLIGVGCRQDMHDQAKHEPYEYSELFADGAAVRVPPQHTVPRGLLDRGDEFVTGSDASGAFLSELPMPLTRELLDHGESRFNTYCSPCHDRTGNGLGMIVRRGFQQPPSYQQERLLQKPVGYFFDVATNGYGQMSGYRAQLSADDRWAVAAWVRVLQRAQNVSVAALTEADRTALEHANDHSSSRSASEDTASGEEH